MIECIPVLPLAETRRQCGLNAGTAHSPEDVVGAILAAIDQSDQAAAERLLGLYLEGKLPAGDVKIMLDNLRLGPRICQICTVTEYVCPACSGLEADLAAALV